MGDDPDVAVAMSHAAFTSKTAHRHVSAWCGLVGALCIAPVLAGCPGTLSAELVMEASGGGGSTGGSGGGAAGAGGSADCINQGAQIVMNVCAQAGCHDSTGAPFSGGLVLTLDSGIASRLVGQTSVGSTANGSSCIGEKEQYLIAGPGPATGLLIDKCTTSPPCGMRMPYDDIPPGYLTAAQQSCLIEWATTLTSP